MSATPTPAPVQNEPKTVTLQIDGLPVTVPEGTLLVEAAKTIRTDIPVYCYHPKLGPAGLCRICLVEIEKTPKLQIACNTTVADGMVVHTRGPNVEAGRRAVLEFLLLNHPLDCPICDKGGECDLQDFALAYGRSSSRLIDPKAKKPKAIDLGPTIVLDEERCIVCQRCTRFDELITGERSLVVKERGQRDLIATADGTPYRSSFSGNVTELCPVGALTSKTYRFKSRPWNNERTQTTCTQCSLGCALQVDVRHGEIARTMSREDDPLSDGWLCDRGRYNIGYVHDARRLVSPLLRAGGGFEQLAWDDAIALVAEKVRAALAAGGPQRIGIVGGGRLLNEELLGLRALAEGLGVRNLDWRASRQRAASFGPGGTPAQLEAAQTILELGNSLAGTAPVLDLRVRKALLHHGARLVSVGSVGASGGRSGVTSELVASVDEISASAFAVERLALVWDGEDPALAAAALARCEAAGVVSCATYVAGEVPNARGAEAFGIVPPAGGLGVRAQLEAAAGGELDVLLIVGANPLLRFPDRALVLRALERAPFVVASELFLTESAAHASLVLPVKSAFEKDGHTANCSGEVLPVRAALAAPEGPLSDLEIFVALAAELGLAFPAPSELSRRAATFPLNGAPHEPATAVPNSANAAARAAEQAPPSARLRLVVMQDIFSGGGTSANDVPVAGLRATPSVTLGPVSARAAGVVAGDRVDLVCDAGRLADLVVVVDERLGEGLARIVDGLPDGPANALGELVRIENVRRASAAQEAALIGGLR